MTLKPRKNLEDKTNMGTYISHDETAVIFTEGDPETARSIIK